MVILTEENTEEERRRWRPMEVHSYRLIPCKTILKANEEEGTLTVQDATGTEREYSLGSNNLKLVPASWYRGGS